ncbi:aminopeptidase [Flavobacterium sp.]|uniref:aminopeptidase n=1 Tax=Flavobacterium sp. TaxID=239 RepID=UPI002FDB4365
MPQKKLLPIFLFLMNLSPILFFGQHQNKLLVELVPERKTLTVQQEIVFHNTTSDTLSTLLLNDWNNAYSAKNTPLAKRFSDEFIRAFHLSKPQERGSTYGITIIDEEKSFLDWCRPDKHPDLIELSLREPLNPNQKIKINLTYFLKLPKDRFTKYGYSETQNYNLKYWYITPARYENGAFCAYSNLNIDDIANAPCDFELTFKTPLGWKLFSDLDEQKESSTSKTTTHTLGGKNRVDFSLFLENQISFQRFKTNKIEVLTNLKENRLDDIQKAIAVDKIIKFTDSLIGIYPYSKITVSQADYEKNPFYGLNQLPAFISPFPDTFLFEIKFLKTYINTFLKNSLKLDPRKDNWIYDAIQIYTMMHYIDTYYPDEKMMGSLSKLKLLKGYTLMQVNFNEQYSYFYMLMARKNLDQPIGNPKNTLLKFNEQIAGKYRAGLSLKYLDNYLGEQKVPLAIQQFYFINTQRESSQDEFKLLLEKQANKNLDWFFNTIINSRNIIDYKFTQLKKSNDSIQFTVKNRTGHTVPIPIFGLQKNQIQFKKWLENVSSDTTLTLPKKDIDKLVINYKNEVPEYNLRNNWKSLNGFIFKNRPIQLNFLKDLENPYRNQILFLPTLEYNLYNGLMPGMRFHNKTFLDKPLVFDLNPAYSTLTQKMIGSFSLLANDFRRESNTYHVRYWLSGQFFDYAPNASYMKLNPSVLIKIRPDNVRDNRKEQLVFREVIVHREKTDLEVPGKENENYAIFNARYLNVRTELTNHVLFKTDLQIANSFGKLGIEAEYRKLFTDNRQINFRWFAGSFLYRKTNSDFFNFALDRPTDYLFDYALYGRSESSGIFSQQYIVAEGAFKSKLENPFANQWMTTLNTSFNIWNWIEIYGDAGLVKNENTPTRFVYDSGIRLNLVTDYFELYFPVHSSNGWEMGQKNYQERIRIMITLNPDVLVGLFTRKWL